MKAHHKALYPLFALLLLFVGQAFAQEDAPPAFNEDVQRRLSDLRADLELLANEADGINRPAGWNGSDDLSNPQLPVLIRLDIEALAQAYLGDERPDGWFGLIQTTNRAFIRDLRHDLELLRATLAEEAFIFTQLPTGWRGSDPMLTCDRPTQVLAEMLARDGLYTPQTDRNAPDYCAQVAIELSRYAEVALLTRAADESLFNPTSDVSGDVVVETEFAVAFLDRNASVTVGTIPIETAVDPIARSYAQFSNMTLVQGDDFIVFVDYRDTTLDTFGFEDLPDVEDIEVEPFCQARWCNR